MLNSKTKLRTRMTRLKTVGANRSTFSGERQILPDRLNPNNKKTLFGPTNIWNDGTVWDDSLLYDN